MWKIIFPKTTSKNARVQKVSEFENLFCVLSPPEALNLVLLSNQCNNISLSPWWHRRLLDYSIVQMWWHFDSNPCLEKCPEARRHSDQVKALSMFQFSKAWSSVHLLYVFMFPHFSLGKLFRFLCLLDIFLHSWVAAATRGAWVSRRNQEIVIWYIYVVSSMFTRVLKNSKFKKKFIPGGDIFHISEWERPSWRYPCNAAGSLLLNLPHPAFSVVHDECDKWRDKCTTFASEHW